MRLRLVNFCLSFSLTACRPVYCSRASGIPSLFVRRTALSRVHTQRRAVIISASILDFTSTPSLIPSMLYTARQRLIVKGLTGSVAAALLALFISPASQIMPQIQVLSLVNREAAAAHRPFILGHVFTWAQNMPGQDNCCHFGGRRKAFCQHPVARE